MLTREYFRNSVFVRDNFKCVICNNPAQDAHHIMERRLWSDGGYYVDNGASLCGKCHLLAESTELSCEEIRAAAGIKDIILPSHLYRDLVYDKWGNIIEKNYRIPGELFYDESVQKVLKPVLHLFKNRFKYPRTYHMPFSPGVTKDDRIIDDMNIFNSKSVVITEKMDGENASIYRDYYHARSLETEGHPSRNWIKRFASNIGWSIPEGFRICGENLYAKHSIKYSNLEDYFLAFSIWNNNKCLSWEETKEWLYLLNVNHVPVIYEGEYDYNILQDIVQKLDLDTQEGVVMRLANEFYYKDFKHSVCKFVRKNHVQSSHNWKYQQIIENELKIC